MKMFARTQPEIVFKIIILLVFSFGILFNASAQSGMVDKNKVSDFFQNQEFDEAINYLLPAARADSDDLQLLGWLGYAFYMNSDLEIAGNYYQKMYSIDSNNLVANQYLAKIAGYNNLEKAQEFTRRLINLQPDKASYHRNMGDLWRKMNQKDSALVYYNQAYLLSPRDNKNATSFADLLVDQKNYIRADSIIELGLAKDSLSAPFLRLRIRCAYESKDFPRALAPGELLVRLGGGSSSALSQLALSYYNLKIYPDCIRICEYMISNAMNSESIYYYEARSWAKLKDYDKSNALLQTCLSLAISKTAELYYYDLGDNDESSKQFKAAVWNYDTAYYLFKNPLMLYNNGRVYETGLHNLKMAQKYYSKYLAVAKPQSPEEKKAYEYVRSKWGKKSIKTAVKK